MLHIPAPPGVTGAVTLERIWQLLLRAFPDVRVVTGDVIADGDKVVVRNGKIAELWGMVDTLAQLRQPGLVPA